MKRRLDNEPVLEAYNKDTGFRLESDDVVNLLELSSQQLTLCFVVASTVSNSVQP